MSTIIATSMLIVISAISLWLDEIYLDPISSMFRLNLLSIVVALGVCYLILRTIEKKQTNFLMRSLGCAFAAFCFFAIWTTLWSTCEQFLIDYYVQTRETGNAERDYFNTHHFYPSASGLPFAKGLSEPLTVGKRALTFGAIGALILGLPFSFLVRPREKSKQTNQANLLLTPRQNLNENFPST